MYAINLSPAEPKSWKVIQPRLLPGNRFCILVSFHRSALICVLPPCALLWTNNSRSLVYIHSSNFGDTSVAYAGAKRFRKCKHREEEAKWYTQLEAISEEEVEIIQKIRSTRNMHLPPPLARRWRESRQGEMMAVYLGKPGRRGRRRYKKCTTLSETTKKRGDSIEWPHWGAVGFPLWFGFFYERVRGNRCLYKPLQASLWRTITNKFAEFTKINRFALSVLKKQPSWKFVIKLSHNKYQPWQIRLLFRILCYVSTDLLVMS